MFVAIRSNDARRVTSIDPSWDDRLDLMRDLAQSGELLCPGCHQQLWLRTGEIRRRHFAHRRLTDCPLGNQSAEVLEVKAQLFLWLQKKFPDAVALDKAIGKPGLDKVVDLLVKLDSGVNFAYWVFDREQRNRDDFSPYRSLSGVFAHFIHTGSTLRKHDTSEITLTASQRAFICCSDFDTCVAGEGSGHMGFYQVEASTLLIYRGLHCVHPPNVYCWKALRQGGLDSALISPKTGEIVFPEDEQARKTWRQKRTNEKCGFSSPKTTIDLEGLKSSDKLTANQGSSDVSQPLSGIVAASQPMNLRGPFRCEDCGTETTDWTSATPSAGTCLCKSCSHKRWEWRRTSTT